jgi:hypothetical protein
VFWYLWGAAVFACTGGLAYVGFDYYRQRRTPLVYPDPSGQFPVTRPQLERGDVLALTEQIAILSQHVKALSAAHQPGQTPASLHYAPHLSYEYEPRFNGGSVLPPDLGAAAQTIRVPTFGELLAQGRVGKGNPLLLGVDLESGEHLAGSWLDLYSTLVGGLPGTGKTTTQRYFAAQVALHGARFVVVDPHLGAADDSLGATLAPLEARYLTPAASDAADILRAVRLVASIGERRIQGQDDSRTPILLWLDEATTLLGHSRIGPELAQLLEQIAQQYRKRGVYACCSGQIWTAARATSELRDSFASAIVHRMKRAQARLILPTDDAQRVERLEKGQAVLWRTSGASTVIQVPNTTSADVQRVAAMLAEPVTEPSPEPAAEPPGSRHQKAQNQESLSARAQTVRDLLRAKASHADIIQTVWGVTGKGRAYQAATEELREIIARLV